MLYGDLRRFGTQYDFNVDTPQEALSGLFSQMADLRKKVIAGVFEVKFNDEIISQDELADAALVGGDRVIHITPAIQGAGKWATVIVGAVLVVAGVIITGGTFGAGAPFGSSLIMMGGSMMLGGLVQALSQPPKMNEPGKGVESSQSSQFSTLDNLTAQGRPKPLACGLIMTGSLVGSQGIESVRNNPDAAAVDPSGEMKEYKKIPIKGIAATAPNGVKYKTDFGHDSVKAQLYKVEE